MNLLHMKYAVEVAQTGSINKAAGKLYVGQSNLSRAIKELETSLGITLFDRSAKGMCLTADGEMFVQYAKTVLKQVDLIEEIFSKGTAGKETFSISVPRASYVAEAFVKFSKLLHADMDAEIFYKETNALRAIKNILEEGYRLGIIRYAKNYDRYYKAMMDEKGLAYELLTEFRFILLMNRESPLAKLEKITYGDLRNYIEIAHADPYVPSLPFAEVKKEELSDNSRRRIFVFERGSQFDLLSQNPETFMRVSPIPPSLLDRYGLTQRGCDENRRVYRDVLIRRKEYAPTQLDRQFIAELDRSKREILDRY